MGICEAVDEKNYMWCFHPLVKSQTYFVLMIFNIVKYTFYFPSCYLKSLEIKQQGTNSYNS